MPKNRIPLNYQNSKIYEIVSDLDDKIYIGSTTQTLSQRYSVHLSIARSLQYTSKFYTAMHGMGVDHFRIILIEMFPCTCKMELEAREYAIMQSYDKLRLYNTLLTMDRKLPDEMRKKISDSTKLISFRENKHYRFTRGYINLISHENRYRFSWTQLSAGVNVRHSKSFSFSARAHVQRTQQMAHLECRDFQNSVFPLLHDDYMSELPFADEP
jgi:hypothetical protein